MMFRQKLLRRVLPVVLSVAMVLETVPATALAAEYEGNEVVEETVLEESETQDKEDDAQNKNNDAQDREDDAQNEEANVSEESAKETQADDLDKNDNDAELVAEDEENAAASLIETEIKVEQKDAGELIAKVYDGEKISYEQNIKNKLTVSVMIDDGDGGEVKLDNAAVKEVWYDAAKLTLGKEADAEPTNAGTYYLGFYYEPEGGDAKAYAPSYLDAEKLIRVVIERAPLTLIPAFKENAPAFSEDMKEADILSYADYKLFDEKNAEFEFDKNTFWGVSYDDISESNTTSKKQSYEPVFQLIRSKKDSSGNPTKDETGKEVWEENKGVALSASKYLYRLVFKGKKAVYTRTGALSGKELNVNGSDVDAEDKNHSIVTTDEILAKNYVNVPVAEVKKTKLDVSGILEEHFNTTDLGDLYKTSHLVSKVYDDKALYEQRADYKKAVVTATNDNQEVAKDYDSAITYTWYRIDRAKEVYDETDPENPKQTGWEVDIKSPLNENNIPTAAGAYMLEVKFQKTGYEECSETIYYRIDEPDSEIENPTPGTTEITLEIDPEKLTTTKNYDGKPFYATEEEGLADIQKALTIKNKETGDVIAEKDAPKFDCDIFDKETSEHIGITEMIYGGSYTLSLSTKPDETYQPAYLDDAAEYTINRIPLTVTPALTEDIPAGTEIKNANNYDGVLYNLSKTEFKGYPEPDAAAFQYGTVYHKGTKTLGFGAYAYVENGQSYYNAPSAVVSKAENADEYKGYIKYGTEYKIKLTGELGYPYNRNYEVNYEEVSLWATSRGNAVVNSHGFPKSTSLFVFSFTKFVQRNEGTTVTITPVAPIAYTSAADLPCTDAYGHVIRDEGNYFEFEIQAPNEFSEDSEDKNCKKYCDGFLYRDSIEAAGGYILEKFEDVTGVYSKSNECIVAFPVKEKEVKNFAITWEDGYTEKFVIDLTNAVLCEDLTKAVAPKSLAFNSVNTKMAVGDEQQLDVKIKKAQISDIIHLDYRVTKGQDVVSVITDDDKGVAGYVTALKPGKATIAAVPVRLINGVKTDIEGAKAAVANITVSDVTAPAIKKITAFDNKVTFAYTKTANGYRREVYLLEGKKKAEDFETLIGTMNNGNWKGIFAVAPQYYANEPLSDTKAKTIIKTINGLLAEKEYTIYVRNVSGIRTLADGTCVQLSAKGAVKSFKTTKPQIEAFRLYAKDDDGNFVTTKNVKLTDKTEQLYTQGQVSTINLDETADTTDKLWLDLPLDKAYGKNFVTPKLVYAVSAEPTALNKVEVSKIRDFRNYTYIGGRYYKKTDIATVDKKGKVTFKGVGKVCVIVYDQTNDQKKAQVTLNIYANADSIKAKNTKLAVGNRVYLSSLLTYYEGKTKISGMDYQNTGILGTSYKPNLTIPAETVSKINREGNFYMEYTGDGDYYITALKPKTECEITATDGALSASLKIQSTPIEPVKSLEITDIADNGFRISISFSVDTDPKRMNRVNITDARGNIVHSEYWSSYLPENYDYDGKKKVYTVTTSKWDASSKKYIPERYTNDKITRLSKYSVSVTTSIGDEVSAKSVTKSVKTTDFPASYEDLGTNYGGMRITAYGVAEAEKVYKENKKYEEIYDITKRKYMTSGNAYTLVADVEKLAGYRMTDTLIWKSSDTKVASVKANAGTYTAQLNALKPGSTVLEVTSKLTKKVVARYPIFVKAVGNAKDFYYGDYEYTGEYPYQYDPYYISGIEVLTLQNPVRVTSSEIYDEYTDNKYGNNDYKWVKFTAPAYGEYKFQCTRTPEQILSSLGNKTFPSKIAKSIPMIEGETLYFKVSGAFTMQVESYVKQSTSLSIDDGSVSIDDDSEQFIEFRATEDNVYTFYSKERPELEIVVNQEFPSELKVEDGIYKEYISIGAGQTIYLKVPAGKYTLYVEKRNAVTMVDGTTLSLTDTVKEKWYTYEVSESGLYTFKSKNATATLTAEYYESLKELNPKSWNVTYDDNNFIGKMMLEAGQKIAFKMSADEPATATISVTPEIPVKLSVGEEKPLPVNADNRRWVTFTLPEAGRYQFRAVSTEADAEYDITLRYYKNAIEENEITTIEKNEILVSDLGNYDPDIAKGDTVYVEVTTNKEGGVANVKVSLTKVEATELTVGKELPITVKNGEEYWYTFTPPKRGNYIVQSVVVPNVDGAETHTLSGGWYTYLEQRNAPTKFDSIGEHDVYGEYIGYSIPGIFQISADDLGLGADGAEITTKATIIVKELTATPLELNQPQESSLLRNERKWYSFTAPETDTYLFRKNMAEGKVYFRYGDEIKASSMQDLNTTEDFHKVPLEKDQTIYIEEIENQGGPARYTQSMELPVKMSGNAEKIATVTSDTAKYYQYTAEKDNRYMVSYTTEPEDAEVTVFWGNSVTSIDKNNNFSYSYQEFPLKADEKRYFKVSTTSETPVTVTMHVDPAEMVLLDIDKETEITVEPGGTTNPTWCSFTAKTAGGYFVKEKDPVPNSGVGIKYFSSITDKQGTDSSEHYYEAGETGYIAVYTTGSEEKTITLIVEEVDIEPIAGETAEDDVSVAETISGNTRKGYLYHAPKTGLYTFTMPSGFKEIVKVFTGNNDVRIDDAVPKTIFLKANDELYISVSNSSSSELSFKFTIALEDEVQTISLDEDSAEIAFGERDDKLIAFSAEDTGFYDFDIAYSIDGDISTEKIAYYMNRNQILKQGNSALYDSKNLSSGSNSIAFRKRLIRQGETVYLYLQKTPSITGADITVTKEDETVVVETLTINEPAEHMFGIGDKIWYVFDAPKDGDYKLTFDWEEDSADTSYTVKYHENRLKEMNATALLISESGGSITRIMKKDQQVCFEIEKKKGDFDAKQLTITISEE